MRVGVAQSQPQFGERDRNLAAAFDLLSRDSADLWVLPEFFASGYQFARTEEVRELAEPIPGGPTVTALESYCHDRRCFVVGGIPELADGVVYNAAALVGPRGYVATYRKIHLFGEEKRWFAPGNLPFSVHNVGDARVGVMICFDHLFPESARTLALLGADLLAHPANLILPDLAQRTMAVRALENGVFAATANRVGEESRTAKTLRYTGQSQIVDPDGATLVRLSPDRVEAGVVEIDPAAARDKRLTSRNDKLADRRPEFYRL
ncbi:MAG: acyltransferase [Candidatus Bipolaricaulis sp.]|nr:acyltransferase [Candidatus Bipolaricaulis sp.]MDD5219787.1 acyltransferase [Candidatus Bipolaricaulis sp.]MDD5646255.1 acyltransferase [Candidatus Bipolaricaulis sp.]